MTIDGGGAGGRQRRNAVRMGGGGTTLHWYLQNAENRLELSSGTDEATRAQSLHLSGSQMLMSEGAGSLEKPRTHTHRNCVLGAVAGVRVQTHTRTILGMQPVCCGGTTSAARAVLPSQHCYFLSFNISRPLSPFIHSSLIFPFIPPILQHPHPTPVHPHHPFSLCLSFSPSIAPTRSR